MTDVYRKPGGVSVVSSASNSKDSMPEILLPTSLSNQFKSYLIALEHMAIDIPMMIKEFEQDGDGNALAVRLSNHLDRINSASKTRG